MATDPQTLLQNMLSTTAVPTSGGIPPAQNPFATQGPLGPGVMAGPSFGGGTWGGQSMFSQQGLEQINQWLGQQSGQPVVPGGQQPPAGPAQPPTAPGPTQPPAQGPLQFGNPIAQAYFTQYPDVAAAYAQNSFGLSPDDFALLHYNKFGKNEQRQWGSAQGPSAPAPGPTTPSTPGVPPAPNPYQPGAPAPAPQQPGGGMNFTDMNAKMYFQNNPDVAAAYAQNSYGMSPDEFAKKHYEMYGRAEQRMWNTPAPTQPAPRTASATAPAPRPAPAPAPTTSSRETRASTSAIPQAESPYRATTTSNQNMTATPEDYLTIYKDDQGNRLTKSQAIAAGYLKQGASGATSFDAKAFGNPDSNNGTKFSPNQKTNIKGPDGRLMTAKQAVAAGKMPAELLLDMTSKSTSPSSPSTQKGFEKQQQLEQSAKSSEAQQTLSQINLGRPVRPDAPFYFAGAEGDLRFITVKEAIKRGLLPASTALIK